MSFVKKVSLKDLRHVLWLVVAILLTIYLILGRKYDFLFVYGHSMEPTYKNGSSIICEINNKNWYPSRYDVVVVMDSKNRENLTKRIIGLEGETVECRNGLFYINDKQLENDTFGNEEDLFIKKIKIPKGCVFVIGDNRNDSMYGIFLLEEIKGEVILNF